MLAKKLLMSAACVRHLNQSTTLLAAAFLCGSLTCSFAGSILVDNFTDGSSFTLSDSSGTAQFNYLSGAANIIGGRRQVRVRAAGSGFYGPSTISDDVSAGTLSSYGGDTGDRSLQYGSAIGSDTQTGAGPGTPVNLNLNLGLNDSISLNVAYAASGDNVGITLFSADSSTYSTTLNVSSSGVYSVNLSSFSGLTAPEAASIDGMTFSPISSASTASTGITLNQLSITTVPEPSTLSLVGLGGLALLVLLRRRQTVLS